MADYISREEAIALAKDIVVPVKDGGEYRHRCIDPQAIMEIPAADVVEVMRCNQCKHYDGVHNVQGCAPCLFWNAMVLWNWFCFNGERNDGADNG